MNPVSAMAKLLIALGLFLLLLGIIALLAGKFNLVLFRLPGDIYIKRDGFTFYFPLVSTLLLSVVLTLLYNLFFRR